MKLKVCGITSVEQLAALGNMGADYAGLIFVPSSPRYAYDKLSPQKEYLKRIAIPKVGVFVNETMASVRTIIDEFGLDYLQLHGDEDVDYVRELNRQIPVIKAFRLSADENISEVTQPYENTCTYFLFDTLSGTGYGGTGKSFNWKILADNINKPFFLSGGISQEHVPALKDFTHPSLYAVDINSRFETEPGVKDLELVRSFKKQLDQAL